VGWRRVRPAALERAIRPLLYHDPAPVVPGGISIRPGWPGTGSTRVGAVSIRPEGA